MNQASFYFTGALDPEHQAHLYVKRPEDDTVRRALSQVGKSCVLVSLIGARQTGKTSLLNRLHAEYGAADSGWIAIKLDLMPFSDYAGEAWYRQVIAVSCARLQQGGVPMSVAELEAVCATTFIPTFGARGWAELLRVACRRLAADQRLLISLDEISSVPQGEWEAFFSNIRALHQAAGSPNDSPECRRLGMILAGAFVPRLLIKKSEHSPFNSSVKVYMTQASATQAESLIQQFVDQGTVPDEETWQKLYEWSGGLLYHLQRLCALLAEQADEAITTKDIETLVDDILLDDTYLEHISSQLEQYPDLVDLVHVVLQRPRQSSRANEAIALLEVAGIIRLDPQQKQWRIVNPLSERYLAQNLPVLASPDDSFAAAITAAMDFLFEEVTVILSMRRASREQRGSYDDTPMLPEDAAITTKIDVRAWRIIVPTIQDTVEGLHHCMNQVQAYRDTYRLLEQQIAEVGGWLNCSIHDKKQLEHAENELKHWCQQLKSLLEQIYERKIVMVGLK